MAQGRMRDPSVFSSAPDGGGKSTMRRRANSECKTMNIELIEGGQAMIINASDFDESVHKRPGSRSRSRSGGDGGGGASEEKKAAKKKAAEKRAAEKKAAEGGGQVDGQVDFDADDNDKGDERSKL